MSRSADLAIWGRVPPPIGGMTVHIQRLLPRLRAAGISVQMYSVGRLTQAHPEVQQVSHRRIRWLIGQMAKGEAVHYVFSDDTSARFAASCLAAFAGRAVILRIGGKSLKRAVTCDSVIERSMIRFAIKHCTAVVGVNDEICELARSLGAQRVHHIPGFIPPQDDGVPVDAAVIDFLNRGTGPVLLGTGEVWPRDGTDLYGAYDFLDLLAAIPEARAVYYAYEISPLGQQPREEWIAEIKRRRLSDRLLAYPSAGALWPTMRSVDLLVRPSRSDGDSNAVREALSLGLPVVASDCVERPYPSIVFPTGDTDAMIAAVRQALDHLPKLRAEAEAAEYPDNAAPVVALIDELLRGPAEGR